MMIKFIILTVQMQKYFIWYRQNANNIVFKFGKPSSQYPGELDLVDAGVYESTCIIRRV